ncbi:E3 ubiquitin-protein ligase rnf8 isoform X1 [Brienomyrus brachyistius]|uniref:E3 ubiquitin-protein ligase rnf8 isoform X1 n=2 Tax=Brienomyrus brachyistius TaxID=42636 RepID=UPI0020B287B6|nr:E3 ubiquitin-protein ligase rnf8 isoform X1 [Brienomyrus brachyistius]
MEQEGVSRPPAAESSSSIDKEIWCLKRVGKNTEWLRLPEDTEVMLGRGLNVTYQIFSSTCPLMISRKHCLLKQNSGGQWTVTDKTSVNGVWVNEERIPTEKAVILNVGDSVKLGVPVDGMRVEFEYVLVRDFLRTLEPFLLTEEHSVGSKSRKAKRKFSVEETAAPAESQSKLYRCSSTDKFLDRSCPIPSDLPASPRSLEAAGPSRMSPTTGVSCVLSDGSSGIACVQQHNQNMQMMRNQLLELERQVASLQAESPGQQEEMEKKQQRESLKKQLENTLLERRKLIEELKLSRQGFEEILQAKDKELEEKEKAWAQKQEVVSQMTEVLESELQCIICSELFIEAVTLNCAHSFCLHCISEWRKRRNECPICRQAIVSQTRSLVLDNCIDRMLEKLGTEVRQHRQALLRQREALDVAAPITPETSPSSSFLIVNSSDLSSSESNSIIMSPDSSLDNDSIVSLIASPESSRVSPVLSVDDDSLVSLVPSSGSNRVSPVPSSGSSHVSPVPSSGSSRLSPVPSSGSSRLSPVPSSGSSHVSPVPSLGSSHVSPVPSSGSSHVSPVPSSGSSHVSPVPYSGSSHVSPVPSSGSSHVSPVPSSGSSHVSPVPSSGSSRVSPVPSSGSSRVSPVPSSGSSRVSPVPSSGSSHVSPVQSSGSSQVSPVHSSGSSRGSPVLSLESSLVSPVTSPESSSWSDVSLAFSDIM